MSRIRRNRDNPIRNTDGYIKKYFGSDISKILVPSIKNIQNCPIPYVNHQEAEAVLSDMLKGDSQKDKSIGFTGLKGSGKTTILRHVFKIEENSNQSKILDNTNTIVIPIDFNRSQISAQTAILSSLRSAIQRICRTFDIDEPNIDNEKFYEFVMVHRDDFLQINEFKTKETSHVDIMRSFLNAAKVPFASCQLQYVLSSEKCSIDLVVLIIDNVEGYSGNGRSRLKYLEPVIEALRLTDCISQRQQPTKWCFNLVIACRHYVWRLIKGEEDENGAETPLLESFITSDYYYDLRKPVEIKQIVGVREEAFSKNQASPKWETSVKVVQEILEKMEGNLGDFVLQLELKDIRKSFETMQLLILHNGLQNKSEEEINNSPGSFQIDSPSQFDLSRINLIRTLAIGKYTYFTGEGRIPNLLYNKKEEYLELYPLLTLKYFLKKCNYEEPAWDNSVSVSMFYHDMGELFEINERQIHRLFMEPVSYFIKHRILLRSADQQQDEVPGLTRNEISKIDNVYVSGAAVKLWEELYSSSALFQLFMDDIYVDSTSDYLGPHGNDIEHCFEYLKYLRSIEERIFNMAANKGRRKIEEYVRCFGKTSICEYLAYGLLNSLEYIATHDYSQRGRKAKETKRQVNSYITNIKKWDS